MEKRVLDRRLAVLEAEGVKFRTNANIGEGIPADELRREFDAVVLCGGATIPRDLPIPGRQLSGVHFAMDYLTQQNRRCEGDDLSSSPLITAAGKRVVIIGGGDTGADCLGTAHRQGLDRYTSSSCCRSRQTRVPTATPGRNGRRSSVSRLRMRKAASASTRCRPPSSSAIATDASRD